MDPISGQTTVATAGTAVPLSTIDRSVNGPVMVKALPGNTGTVYVGRVDGDVASGNGMPLDAKEYIVFENVHRLDQIFVDASAINQSVAWLLLDA